MGDLNPSFKKESPEKKFFLPLFLKNLKLGKQNLLFKKKHINNIIL
jgi:hypothetical protein